MVACDFKKFISGHKNRPNSSVMASWIMVFQIFLAASYVFSRNEGEKQEIHFSHGVKA
jgi:hypothetical protein